tara:strand:+ start:490 stop:945 length:456 start_codon:yes stop_codon:yes gene_type:complete
MNQNIQDNLNKVSNAIPEGVKQGMTKARGHKYFSFIAGGVVIALLWLIFSGSSLIPPESVMRSLLAADENVETKFGSITMTSFEVKSCDVVENDAEEDVAQCTITYGNTSYLPESNHFRHRPASKTTLPLSTEKFQFWKNDKGRWKMHRLY